MQKDIHEDLDTEYKKYVASIFEDVNKLELPYIGRFKKQTSTYGYFCIQSISR